MKRNIITGLVVCMGFLPLQAQTFSITDFSIPAGGVADVDICLDCEAGKWGAFQFDLVLPTGIHVFEDEEGLYYEVSERLQYRYNRRNYEFNVNGSLQGDETRFRVLIDNSHAQTVSGTSGALLSLRLQADDFLDTDWVTLGMENIVCTGPAGDGTVYPENIAAVGHGAVRVDAVVGATGWATFSWPRSCDFTDLPVEAYIGTQLGDGYLHLERVYNVRQNTGILLHGEPGTYNPTVGADSGHDYDDTSANVLAQTASAPYVAGDGNCYVLTRHDGEVGFYVAKDGVEVPQYKAYLAVDAAADVPLFVGIEGLWNDATRVTQTEPTTVSDDGVWYRLDGTRVAKPTQRGIYVKQGKKVKL